VSKREVAEHILAEGLLHVHLDARREGVIVPEHLRAQPNLILAVGRTGLAVPIPDLVVDEHGIHGTLSFEGEPFACTVPWSAVFALADTRARGRVFREDMPPDLPKRPPHEEECSFCLAPRTGVGQLVSGPRASICDACIRRHRPRGVFATLRAWVGADASTKGELMKMPYRDLAPGCSFCGDASARTVAGVRARICDACLDLARDSLPR